MKFKKIAICLALSLVLTACGTAADTGVTPEEPEQEITEVTEDPETEEPAEPEEKPEEQPEEKPEEQPEEKPEAEELTFIEDAGTTTLNGYTVKPIPDNEAFEFVSGMRGGMNLGNAFDAQDCTWLTDEMEYESAWCGAKTTTQYIDSLCNEGFNVIRIPVSWHNHVDSNFNISAQWLDRVTEVVDYCLDKDMYVIINMHHDINKNYFYPDSAHLDNTLKYTEAIWSQLSERFKDRSEKLIFECINEPRLRDTDVEWWYNSETDKVIDAYNALMEANQCFVDTVRASGGNNADRYLMVCGYCDMPAATTSENFSLPNDPAPGRLMVTVHSYRPYSFAGEIPGTASFGQQEMNENKQIFSSLYNTYVANGIPVIMGEYGCVDKKNAADRLAYFEFMGECSALYSIPIIVWDNNAFNTGNDPMAESFGFIDRATGAVKLQELVDAMTATYKE